MASYTEFAEKVLIALYQESDRADTYERFEDLLGKYGLPSNEKWIQRLSDEWEANGYVDVQSFIGSPLHWGGEITGAGMRYIENKYGSKDGVSQILEPVQRPDVVPGTESGVPITTENGEFIVVGSAPDSRSDAIDYALPTPDTPPTAGTAIEFSGGVSSVTTDKPVSIDSRDWTGTRHVLVDRAVVENVRLKASELKRLVHEVHIPNNAHSADLKALVDMLIQALDMCEPEVTLIERILASPKFRITASILAAAATVRGALGI